MNLKANVANKNEDMKKFTNIISDLEQKVSVLNKKNEE